MVIQQQHWRNSLTCRTKETIILRTEQNRTEQNRTEQNRRHLVGIDFLRIISVIMIFLFHGRSYLEVNLKVLNPFVRSGAIFMDLFFMISGFVVYYNYFNKNILKLKNYKTFLIKRISALYPSYVVVAIISSLTFDKGTLKETILQLPLDGALLQSTVETSFHSLHHGGSWFISCLFICYLLSPYICALVMQFTKRQSNRMLLVIYLICSYVPLLCHILNYNNVYSSIFYRTLHFMIGAVICELFQNRKKILSHNKVLLLSTVLLIGLFLGISFLKYFEFGTYNDYDFYAIPIFGCILYIMSFASENSVLGSFVNCKVVIWFNKISYEFFLGQFFCFKIVKMIDPSKNINMYVRLFISFIVCICIAGVLHELVSKPCKKYLTRRFL